jgi:hypothetical protein
MATHNDSIREEHSGSKEKSPYVRVGIQRTGMCHISPFIKLEKLGYGSFTIRPIPISNLLYYIH